MANITSIRRKFSNAALKLWKYSFGPFFGDRCRFRPTCSEYASEAVSTHGFAKGGFLAVKRIFKCHPFGSSGFDPVPRSSHHIGES